MRDPDRIGKVLAALGAYWRQPLNQDMRLGQIVGNFARDLDPYFLEDDVLLERLQAHLRPGTEPSPTSAARRAAEVAQDKVHQGVAQG